MAGAWHMTWLIVLAISVAVFGQEQIVLPRCPVVQSETHYAVYGTASNAPGYVKNCECEGPVLTGDTVTSSTPYYVSIVWMDFQGGDAVYFLDWNATLRFTGNIPPPYTIVIPYCDELKVFNYADSFYEGDGFSMVVTRHPVMCSGVRYVTGQLQGGAISLPDFSNYTWGVRYPPNGNCSVVIQAPVGMVVDLYISKLVTEAGADLVTVYDTDGSVLGVYSYDITILQITLDELTGWLRDYTPPPVFCMVLRRMNHLGALPRIAEALRARADAWTVRLEARAKEFAAIVRDRVAAQEQAQAQAQLEAEQGGEVVAVPLLSDAERRRQREVVEDLGRLEAFAVAVRDLRNLLRREDLTETLERLKGPVH